MRENDALSSHNKTGSNSSFRSSHSFLARLIYVHDMAVISTREQPWGKQGITKETRSPTPKEELRAHSTEPISKRGGAAFTFPFPKTLVARRFVGHRRIERSWFRGKIIRGDGRGGILAAAHN